MSDNMKKASAEALSHVLADTYFLYLKTHNFHWNVVGPRFRMLHEMFEEQYRDLWNALDGIAERIRALGEPAPGTYAKFAKLATITENEEIPAADAMLAELIDDHRTLVAGLATAIRQAEEAGDAVTAGLLADRQEFHEKQIWMMQASLA